MTMHFFTRFQAKSVLLILGAVFACLVLVYRPSATAQDASATPRAGASASFLESRRFVGKMGVESETRPEDDVFTFKDGTFSAKSCAEWGFAPAPYWVRRDSDGRLHFLSTLKSPEHGVMHYEGVYDGKQMKATAKWTKERWYWTTERKYVFTGHPAGPAK